MKIKSVRTIIIAAATLFGCAVALRSAEPANPDVAMATKLIKAIKQSDYEAFIADGEPAFQQMKKEQFAAVAGQLAPRFQAGFEISYLGDLRQRGYHVILCKISFKDGRDDALATLSMKEGKVGGFFIR